MQINIKIILDAVNILKMRQEGKNLIIKRIEIIHKLFDNFQLYRKKIENIKSKNLLNNQIYEEVRRRLCENKKFYDEKISDINSLMKKKVIILKKVQKKFLEIQIYIRRESQNFFGFRKQFANFSITPFILENEYRVICPMASKKEIVKQGGEYPKYKALIIRTIHRLRENGYMNKYKSLTDEEIFEWWISKENMEKWYYSHKVQLSLFDMDDYKTI